MGGSDDKTNLVDLTPREHFIIHWMLKNIHGGKMAHAWWFMCRGRLKLRHNFTSRQYEFARRAVLQQRRIQFPELELICKFCDRKFIFCPTRNQKHVAKNRDPDCCSVYPCTFLMKNGHQKIHFSVVKNYYETWKQKQNLDRKCEFCSKPYHAHIDNQGRLCKNKFCSPACIRLFNSNHKPIHYTTLFEHLKCANTQCQKEFKRTRLIQTNQYCSRKCAWSYNSFPISACEKFSSGKRRQRSRKGLTNIRNHKQNRCKLCGEFGHNKLTCRVPYSC